MNASPASFYILFSPSLDKYYGGITTKDVESRILKHNSSYYGTHYAYSANDWELRLNLLCETYLFARKTELYVK